MTTRDTFNHLWRSARIETRRAISPEYVDTITSRPLGVLVLIRYDGQPVETRRDGRYAIPARRHWHITQAAQARHKAASLPVGLSRLIALDDHARHIREARRQPA